MDLLQTAFEAPQFRERFVSKQEFSSFSQVSDVNCFDVYPVCAAGGALMMETLETVLGL